MLWLCLNVPALASHDTAPDSTPTLEALAHWAGQITSRVSLARPAALLLEIAGSLHYFQGLTALRARIEQSLSPLQGHYQMGIAPTPTAAWLCARAHYSQAITQQSSISEHLNPLPIDALALNAREADALQGLGCRTLGDIRALPSAGLTRRIGTALVHTLQRAYGERPDPRADWQPAICFERNQALPDEVTTVQGLQPWLHALIDALCAHLRQVDAQIMQFECSASYRQQAPTAWHVGTLRPGRDAEQLKRLLDHRLEPTQLPAGVIAIGLKAGHHYPTTLNHPDWIDADLFAQQPPPWQGLVETLGHRLGEDGVHTLALCDEHRPEHAWRYAPPGPDSSAVNEPMTNNPRPFWLLPKPCALASEQGQPSYHGPLVLEQGPERIEAGWWDDQDISRDYYCARSCHGERLWVFRERRRPRGWFLHGFFA